MNVAFVLEDTQAFYWNSIVLTLDSTSWANNNDEYLNPDGHENSAYCYFLDPSADTTTKVHAKKRNCLETYLR